MSIEEKKVMLLREEDAKKRLDEMALDSIARADEFKKELTKGGRFLKKKDLLELVFGGVTNRTLDNHFLAEAIRKGEVTIYNLGSVQLYDVEEVIAVFKQKQQVFI